MIKELCNKVTSSLWERDILLLTISVNRKQTSVYLSLMASTVVVAVMKIALNNSAVMKIALNNNAVIIKRRRVFMGKVSFGELG